MRPLSISTLLILVRPSSRISRFLVIIPSGKEPELILWPIPNNYVFGEKNITINMKDLKLDATNQNQDVLDAFDRIKEFIALHTQASLEKYDVDTLHVEIENLECPLAQDVNESYTLVVPDNSNVITITAPCINGYYHALHTFAQLVQFMPTKHSYMIKKAPWSIKDEPLFSYRGVMIDSARHFLPVKTIKSVIESLSIFKLNVLHWHITDDQSFPLEIPNYDASPAAFSQYERYSVEDAKEIVEFARKRGVRVIAEVDVPGHASVWCNIDSSICPSTECRSPLNPANEHTFDFIDNIIKNFAEIFPDAFFHIGGDEVDTSCWNKVPEVADWMAAHNFTTTDAYSYFILRVRDIVIKYERTPVFWEEVFNSFSVPKDSIIEIWLGNKDKMRQVVSKGHRGIFSSYTEWYLSQPKRDWREVYNADLMRGITDPELQKLVLGGEVCMWGETADMSDLEQTIWPRGIAAAERLWTRPEFTDVEKATERYAYQRCYMNWKGIVANPAFLPGRTAPGSPLACMMQ